MLTDVLGALFAAIQVVTPTEYSALIQLSYALIVLMLGLLQRVWATVHQKFIRPKPAVNLVVVIVVLYHTKSLGS